MSITTGSTANSSLESNPRPDGAAAAQSPGSPLASLPDSPPASGGGPAGPATPRRASRPGRLPPASLAQRISLMALLLGTSVLYLWNLGANGWGNAFYSAAIQAGSQDWTAFIFGSSDSGNSITVDKPPASLWIPALSVRIFGLNSWSILVPEALMGVAAVWLLYSAVARVSGRWVGLVAGLALATTPVALLMFRYNNPEALLILLSVAAVYGLIRAVQASSLAAAGTPAKRGRGALAWMLMVGAMIGLGFLTKQLQAVVIVPTLAMAYLVAARGPWLKHMLHLLSAAAAMVVSAGWWVALVQLWPAASRPYIGGSQSNSFLELTFGYNGLGRLNGEEEGSVGSRWGTPSLLRLVTGNYVTQISWLIPAALIALLACLVLILRTRAWRSDDGRLRIAAVIALGGWFVVEGLTISLMQGITHEYYTAILAAPLAAIVAIGAGWLWERSTSWTASLTLALMVAATTMTAFIVLVQADWGSVWASIGVVLALMGAFGLALRPVWPGRAREGGAGAGAGASAPEAKGSSAARAPGKVRRGLSVAAVSAVLVGGLGAQSAFAASTTSVAKTGSIIYAGTSNGMGGPGGGMGAGPGGNSAGQGGGQRDGQRDGQGMPGGTPPGGTNRGGMGDMGGEDGGAGGLLNAGTPSGELVALLQADSATYRWTAATTGAQSAAGYQLGSNTSVMPSGGFNGTDPSPTLEQFKEWATSGQIHYYIASGSGGMGGGGMGGGSGSGDSSASAISSWVSQHYTSTTVDGVTLYDLTQPNS